MYLIQLGLNYPNVAKFNVQSDGKNVTVTLLFPKAESQKFEPSPFINLGRFSKKQFKKKGQLINQLNCYKEHLSAESCEQLDAFINEFDMRLDAAKEKKAKEKSELIKSKEDRVENYYRCYPKI